MRAALFPLWWDMLAVAVFTLVVDAWALRVALPAARVEERVGAAPAHAPIALREVA